MPSNKKSNRNLAEVVAVLAILCVLSPLLLAEEYNFTGTGRGRLFDDGRGEYGVGCSAGCAPIILRVATVNREKGVAKGKFTAGGSTEDIREAKVMGNKLTFMTGKPPAEINDCEAILNGAYLKFTWTPEGGGGRPQTLSLMRSK